MRAQAATDGPNTHDIRYVAGCPRTMHTRMRVSQAELMDGSVS